MTHPTLQSTFRQIRRRVVALGAAGAVAWGLAGAIVLLLAGAWLDLLWDLSPGGRIGLLAAAGLLGAVLAGSLAATIAGKAALGRFRRSALQRRPSRGGARFPRACVQRLLPRHMASRAPAAFAGDVVRLRPGLDVAVARRRRRRPRRLDRLTASVAHRRVADDAGPQHRKFLCLVSVLVPEQHFLKSL